MNKIRRFKIIKKRYYKLIIFLVLIFTLVFRISDFHYTFLWSVVDKNQNIHKSSNVKLIINCDGGFYVNNTLYSQSTLYLNATSGSNLLISINEYKKQNPVGIGNVTFHHWEDNLGFYSEQNSINYKVRDQDSILTAIYLPDFIYQECDWGEQWQTSFTFLEMEANISDLQGLTNFEFNGTHMFMSNTGVGALGVIDLNLNPPKFIDLNLNPPREKPPVISPEIGEINGSYYYIGSFNHSSPNGSEYRLFIYNFSNNYTDLNNWVELSSLKLDDFVEYLILNNHFCYVFDLNHDNMSIINTTDLSNQTFIGKIKLNLSNYEIDSVDDLQDHLIYNDCLYLLFGEGCILIMNISIPSSPTIANYINTNSTIQDGFINNTLLYIASRNKGFQIYNLSNQFSPEFICSYNETLSDCWSIWINGSSLFIADGMKGIKIFNISDLQSPHLIFNFSGSDLMTCILYYNGFIVAGDYRGNFMVYNWTSESQKLVKKLYTTKLGSGTYLFRIDYGSIWGDYFGGGFSSAFSCPIQYIIPDEFGHYQSIRSNLWLEELVFFNDTNRDGKFTTNMSVDKYNPDYYLDSRTIIDDIIGETKLQDHGVQGIPEPITSVRKNNITYIILNISYNNMSIYKYPDKNDVIGKVNCTYTFIICLNYSNIAFNPNVKFGINFITYNLGPELSGNFSVKTGYSLHSETFFNWTESKGHFDYGGIPILGFELEPTYNITRNHSISTHNINFSHRIHGRLINYPNTVAFLVNFINIQGGDIVTYDPKATLRGGKFNFQTEFEPLQHNPSNNHSNLLTINYFGILIIVGVIFLIPILIKRKNRTITINY
ncbi:MAG: hypothetical protein ACTSPY_05940 [Candidatus Helarchaeota archaeon]